MRLFQSLCRTITVASVPRAKPAICACGLRSRASKNAPRNMKAAP